MSQLRPQNIESVLIADCGSNTTRVVLIEIVEQAYRFIARGEAPSTLEEPYNDVTIGVLNAIAAIESNTGRQLLVGGRLLVPQQPDGTGVDAFVACSSAAEPLRVVAAGVSRNLSAESASRASHATYTTVLDTISLDEYGDSYDVKQAPSAVDFDPEDPAAEFSPFTSDKQANPKATNKISLFGGGPRRIWKERQIAKLRRLAPNVVVLAGGSDGAPVDSLLELMDVIIEVNRQEAVLANALGEIRRPLTLVYVGNQQGREAIIERNRGQVELFMSDNILPNLERENLKPLQSQLTALYQERLLPVLPGYRRLTEMCQTPVTTTCSAVGLMTQFLAKDVPDNRVLTADLGGSNSALFYADAENFVSMVRGGFGLSLGISNVLAETNPENLRRWLPFEISDDDLTHYALNKILRPQVLPANEQELQLDGAFGREALRVLAAQLHGQTSEEQLNYNRVLGAGGPLVNISQWQAALMLLDGLQPPGNPDTGLVELELDSTMLLAATGALAALDPNAAAYVFRYDCLHRLGPVIVLHGSGPLGSPAVSVTMTTKAGRIKRASVPFGQIALLPLRSDEQATLEIQPEGNFRVGKAGRGLIVRTPAGQEMRGGSLGLIIDARGRPIQFASDPAQRRLQVQQWHNVHRLALQQAETEESITLNPAPARNATLASSPEPVTAGKNAGSSTNGHSEDGNSTKLGNFRLGKKK